jgi:uncharacterized protein (TIGR03000 family)
MFSRILSIPVVLILAGAIQAASDGDKSSRQTDHATVTVSLPADATLQVQGVKTRSKGDVREFTSPPLPVGRRFTYLFRATWTERGRPVTQSQKVVVTAGAEVRVRFPVPPREQPATRFEGQIKDVRPAWGILILTVGKGKEARDLRFDMSEARIVGPSGAEWKGEDLKIGDPVRVEMTSDGTLVQQISVLPDKARGLNK